MNLFSRNSSRARAAISRRSYAAPARDIQWNRPVFRPPALTAQPPLLGKAPFTAMRPERPTQR